MGCRQIHTDSAGAISFKYDTCPTSKIRGCFDFREDWVEELKGIERISVVRVSDSNNLADQFTKCYETYKYRARVKQLREFSGIGELDGV